jgi:hypothetical protein
MNWENNDFRTTYICDELNNSLYTTFEASVKVNANARKLLHLFEYARYTIDCGRNVDAINLIYLQQSWNNNKP